MSLALSADRFTDLVGAPWRKGGRSPDGFDCLGVVLFALQRAGIACRDPWDEVEAARRGAWQYGQTDIRGQWWSGWRDVTAEPRAPGDVLGLGSTEVPTHTALLLEGELCLQALHPGVVIVPVRKVEARIRNVWRWVG